MAKFNNTNNTTDGAVAKGTPRCTRVNLVHSAKAPSLVAFANVIFDGRVFINDIWVRENASGDAFLSFPSQKRTKNGQDVLDENGKPIYDDYCGPASKEAREKIQNMVFDAVQAAMDGTPQTIAKGEEGVRVTLMPEGSKAVAVCSIVVDSLVFMNSIAVRENASGEAYLACPSHKRTKNGTDVLDENGKVIYDSYYGPASKEAREALDTMVFDAVQAELDKEN